MILRQGSQGLEVEQLQLKLKAAGYDVGDIDGDFGTKTLAAVHQFQLDRPDVDDDNEVGPQTLGALNAAIAKTKPASATPAAPSSIVPCNAATWAQVTALFAAVTKNAKYGPGRGLWVKDKLVVTYGAGQLGGTTKQWPNALGKTYPSFHCTSWCNFFMSFLCRRNQDFTHAGNIPEIWELLLSTPDIHQNPGAGPYRGFGDVCYPITPDGSAVQRHGVPKIMDARELYARRAVLPTFTVFGQSTKKASGWNWWHHTGLYIAWEGKLYRIAADGYKGASGYSGSPMQLIEITPANVGNFDACIYRCYGVRTTDGTYGDKSRPYATVDFEL